MADKLLYYDGVVDELYDLYWSKKYSIYEISELKNVGRKLVNQRLREFGIPIKSRRQTNEDRRTKNGVYSPSTEELRHWYHDNKMTCKQIGDFCGASRAVVDVWLKNSGIEHRSNSEARHLRMATSCDLSGDLLEWINGELLGDGCVSITRSRFCGYFCYASKFREYINYVSEFLSQRGIKQRSYIRVRYDKGKPYYHYLSKNYPELLELRRRWYPEGAKIVPKDIQLTSLTCRQWYIGDGSCNSSRRDLRLHSQGFPIEDVEFLVDKLKNIGFKCSRLKNSNDIYIWSKSINDFIDYIGECPVDCYRYKWDVPKARPRSDNTK